jgi:hypothetical protein
MCRAWIAATIASVTDPVDLHARREPSTSDRLQLVKDRRAQDVVVLAQDGPPRLEVQSPCHAPAPTTIHLITSSYAPRACLHTRFAIKMSGLPHPFASGITPTITNPTF